MNKIYIYHQNWQESCLINIKQNIIKRINQEQGIIELKSYFLKIKWDNYDEFDYFFSKDAVHYYQNSSSYSFYLLPQYTVVRLFYNQKSSSIHEKKYFLDKINQIAYDMNNYDLYYKYSVEENVLKQMKHTLLTLYIPHKSIKYICFQEHDYIEYELYYENYEEIIIMNNKNEDKLKNNCKSKYVILDKMKKIYYVNKSKCRRCNLILSAEGTFEKKNNYLQLFPFIKSVNSNKEQTWIYKLNLYSFYDLKHNIYILISDKNNVENKTEIELNNKNIRSFEDFKKIYQYVMKKKTFKKNTESIPIFLFFSELNTSKNIEDNSLCSIEKNREESLLDIIYVIQFYQENKIPYVLCDSYLNQEKNMCFSDIMIYYHYFDNEKTYLEFTEKIRQNYEKVIINEQSFSYLETYIISKMENYSKKTMIQKNKKTSANTCTGKIPKNKEYYL